MGGDVTSPSIIASEFRELGAAICGPRWQRALARRLGLVEGETMTQRSNQTRTMTHLERVSHG